MRPPPRSSNEQALTAAQTGLHEKDQQLANLSFDRMLFELLDGVREEISRLFGTSRDADSINVDVLAGSAIRQSGSLVFG